MAGAWGRGVAYEPAPEGDRASRVGHLATLATRPEPNGDSGTDTGRIYALEVPAASSGGL